MSDNPWNVSESPPPRDYLRDEVAGAFFDAREHEAYYRSLKRGDLKQRTAWRAFHDRLRPVLLRLLAAANDEGIALLEQLITATAREVEQAASAKTHGCLADRVRRIEPEGMRILGDDAGRDLEHLRAAYRAAALRCHPDRGGSHHDMIAVNRAFEILHRLLVEEAGAEPIGAGDGGASGTTPNALAYLWAVRRLLFGIAFDDWALEEASDYLLELVPVQAVPTPKAEFPNIPFLIYNPESERIGRMYDVMEQASKLTVRLCAARRTDSAARSLAIARELNGVLDDCAAENDASKIGIAIDGKVHHATQTHPSVRNAAECVAGRRKPQFVLESVRQVENAFRLGAIDEKRYRADLSRVARNETQVEADRRERLAILARTQFAPLLPSDAQLKPSRDTGRMVPRPGPGPEQAEHLTPDQQAMYLKAFRSADDVQLIEWYGRIRLNSVLRSAILFPNRCDLASLAEEAEALARLGSSQDGCGWLGRATADLILLIAALDGSQRPEFLSQLAKLLRRGYGRWYIFKSAWKLAEKFGGRSADQFEFRAMYYRGAR